MNNATNYRMNFVITFHYKAIRQRNWRELCSFAIHSYEEFLIIHNSLCLPAGTKELEIELDGTYNGKSYHIRGGLLEIKDLLNSIHIYNN